MRWDLPLFFAGPSNYIIVCIPCLSSIIFIIIISLLKTKMRTYDLKSQIYYYFSSIIYY